MFFKTNFLLCVIFSTLAGGVFAQQKLNDFNLSNFSKDGAQSWEVKGKEAQIEENIVNIDKMKAKLSNEGDVVDITSDKAKLNKDTMDVYLKDDVHIKNNDGSTFVTDSLKWNRSTGKIETQDWVKAGNDSMQIKAQGLQADSGTKNVDFEKNIEMLIQDKEGSSIKITCRGPLEMQYEKGLGVFNNDVVVESKEGKLFADKTTAIFNSKEKKMEKIICEGNVRIVREDNITMADKATFVGDDKRIVLEGNPRLFYFPGENKQQ